MKPCITCGVLKPLSEFWAQPTNRDKLWARCKGCERIRRKVYADQPHVKAAARAATRRWFQRNPQARGQAAAKHPDRFRAAKRVGMAVFRGKLIRQPCEVCGTTAHVHGHHADYTKPLDVRWLCALHHKAVHMGVLA